jgi:hypothetical protein
MIVFYDGIFKWHGHATPFEMETKQAHISKCRIIIAKGEGEGPFWVFASDLGPDSGTSITNCSGYLIPLVCNYFNINLPDVVWIEVYPCHYPGNFNGAFNRVEVLKTMNIEQITPGWRVCNAEEASVVNDVIRIMNNLGSPLVL